MLHECCTRLKAKIWRLGYSPHLTNVLLLFLIRCMTVVCAVMGVLNVPGPASWESPHNSPNPAPDSFTPVRFFAGAIHRSLLF